MTHFNSDIIREIIFLSLCFTRIQIIILPTKYTFCDLYRDASRRNERKDVNVSSLHYTLPRMSAYKLATACNKICLLVSSTQTTRLVCRYALVAVPRNSCLMRKRDPSTKAA